MTDDIKQPSHYTTGKIETWDYIRDQELGYHLGNAVKYISRAGKKPYDGLSLQQAYIKDLKKAITYLENELYHASSFVGTFHVEEPVGPSNRVPFSVRGEEFDGQPDYATGFDR